MNVRTRALCMLAFALSSMAPAGALSPYFDPQTMMPTSEIQAGMKAVGKTVFSGVTITDFHLEIVGVLEKWNLGEDLILAKILDGPCVERRTGIIGGMSGSPVYINGRLIGATAYGWDFPREAMCGITAIDSMLDALGTATPTKTVAPAPKVGGQFSTRDGAVAVAGHKISAVRVVSREQSKALFADDHTLLMYPVAEPLYCAGMPEAALRFLKDRLPGRNLEPMAAPGITQKPVPVELTAGAAFGALLAWGDFDISTGGTVTYRKGDSLLGFGHPLFEMGTVDVPLTTAWVHDFIPRYSRTDKVMSPMKEIGALKTDRPWAVGGALGPTSARVPASFKITDETRQRTKTYHVEMIRNEDLTPALLASCALSAVESSYNASGKGMVRLKTQIKGTKGDSISREDIYYNEGDPLSIAIGGVLEGCGILTQNRWRSQDIASCEYEATLSKAQDAAAIEEIYADQSVAKAGEEVTLHVRIRPQDGELVERTITLPIPLGLEKSAVRFAVSGGTDAMRTRSRAGVMPPTFYSLDDFLKVYEGQERGNQLFACAGIATRDLSVDGTKLFWLPNSLKSLLENAQRTDLTRGGVEVSKTIDVPWVLFGGASLTLPSEDRFGRQVKGSSPGSRPTPPDEPGEEDIAARLPKGVPASLAWAHSAFTPSLRFRPVQAEPMNGETDKKKDEKPTSETAAKETKTSEEEAAAEEEEAPPEEEETTTDKKEGAVARGPSFWSQTSESDFTAGESKGLAIRSDGALQLAPEWARPTKFGELYLTALAGSADQVYAGTSGPGIVYRLENGTPKTFYNPGQFGISALCDDGACGLLVGTMPQGRIFRVEAEGKGKELCKVDADYVWDIIPDGSGGFYVGTGPEAKVWRLTLDGKLEKVVELRQGHVLRLLRVKDDLYLGTAKRGAVYRLDAARNLTCLWEAADNDITGLVSGADGTVLASTAPQGKVVALRPDGSLTTWYDNSSAGILSLAKVGDRLFAGSDDNAQIFELINPKARSVVLRKDGCQAARLWGNGTALHVALSSPGVVLSADTSAPGKGEYLSAVFDSKRPSQWGRVDWQGVTPPGTSTMLQVRAGNSGDPRDPSWSPWSVALAEPGREKVSAPAGQYLQYRVEMTKGAGQAVPLLDWLRISYLPANQEPTLKDVKPTEGSAVSGKAKVQWKMEDGDKDKLQARVLYRLRGERDFKVLKENITDTEYEWDTKSVADGVYDLRVIADDGLSNPTGSRSVTVDVANITIDNKAPEVQIITGPSQQTDGGWALTGFALDATSRIANLSWAPKGESLWRAVRLDDGIYDWRYERFLLLTPPLKSSVTEIVIRARDAAGNVTDQTVKLLAKAAEAEKSDKTEKSDKGTAPNSKNGKTEKPATPAPKPATP